MERKVILVEAVVQANGGATAKQVFICLMFALLFLALSGILFWATFQEDINPDGAYSVYIVAAVCYFLATAGTLFWITFRLSRRRRELEQFARERLKKIHIASRCI